MNTCIFCLEGLHRLLYNVKCRCNFYFHMECYDLYNNKTVCPICRKEVGQLFSDTYVEFIQPTAPPTTLPTFVPYVITPPQTQVLQQSRCRWLCIVLCLLILLIIILSTVGYYIKQ